MARTLEETKEYIRTEGKKEDLKPAMIDELIDSIETDADGNVSVLEFAKISATLVYAANLRHGMKAMQEESKQLREELQERRRTGETHLEYLERKQKEGE